MIFLAELNGLETWATDIGNAYLEAETNEKVYIIAGPEFGDVESLPAVAVELPLPSMMSCYPLSRNTTP